MTNKSRQSGYYWVKRSSRSKWEIMLLKLCDGGTLRYYSSDGLYYYGWELLEINEQPIINDKN